MLTPPILTLLILNIPPLALLYANAIDAKGTDANAPYITVIHRIATDATAVYGIANVTDTTAIYAIANAADVITNANANADNTDGNAIDANADAADDNAVLTLHLLVLSLPMLTLSLLSLTPMNSMLPNVPR